MRRPALDVTGRVVLVTGGARGIGLDTAQRLAARGARLALLDIDGAEAQRAASPLGGGAIAEAVDVTDVEALAAAVQRVVDRLGGIDVVIANAGIEPPPATMLSVDRAQFDRVLEVGRAGEAIARGVERRAARMTAPRWVAPALVLRGVIAGLDGVLGRDRRLHEAIRLMESSPPAAVASPPGVEAGG
jgi:NAD(P)-dependent dehydrogenase (short-subunit alcohol dehydrogenase family)